MRILIALLLLSAVPAWAGDLPRLTAKTPERIRSAEDLRLKALKLTEARLAEIEIEEKPSQPAIDDLKKRIAKLRKKNCQVLPAINLEEHNSQFVLMPFRMRIWEVQTGNVILALPLQGRVRYTYSTAVNQGGYSAVEDDVKIGLTGFDTAVREDAILYTGLPLRYVGDVDGLHTYAAATPDEVLKWIGEELKRIGDDE